MQRGTSSCPSCPKAPSTMRQDPSGGPQVGTLLFSHDILDDIWHGGDTYTMMGTCTMYDGSTDTCMMVGCGIAYTKLQQSHLTVSWQALVKMRYGSPLPSQVRHRLGLLHGLVQGTGLLCRRFFRVQNEQHIMCDIEIYSKTECPNNCRLSTGMWPRP